MIDRALLDTNLSLGPRDKGRASCYFRGRIEFLR